MANIKIMSNSLANKIAAGEVVERPSSVVKELIENAIDAKSTKIDIFLNEAGLHSIKVIDNGIGMDKEDAMLAFERHATSKLLKEQDMFRIHTLGFRGEALPSIASVSDTHLRTSTGGVGTYVYFRGGKLIKKEPSNARKGTEIIVNNLFFNTPARLKYLKTLNTELGYTIDYVNKIAISRPDIAIKLVNNNRALLQTNGNNNVLNVLSSIYGIEVVKKMKLVEYSDHLVKIKMHFSEPDINRTSKNYITIVVNNRIVKNTEIVRAIIEGYHTYLPLHRYPVVVVNMKIDPLLIDVNVHPAKLEIRFSNQEHIKSVIIDSIRKKLRELMYIPKVNIRKDLDEKIDVQQEIDFTDKEMNNIKESISNLLIEEEKEIKYKTNEKIEKAVDNFVVSKEKLPKLYYIGQLSGTYLLAQNNNGLYMIDQHAAQERINYEYYLKHFSEDIKEVYELLVPLTLEFSMNESLLIEENINIIDNLNIKIEKFGISSFIVTKVPNWFNKGYEKEILNEILKYVLENKKVDNNKIFNKLAISLSCKRSIKANHYINENEVNNLLKDLENCENPYTCPHGRPVIVLLSNQEIERLFKRSL